MSSGQFEHCLLEEVANFSTLFDMFTTT